jgi:4-amino-4-deoxy-L-arabinose transferase-like glycosyltransferase
MLGAGSVFEKLRTWHLLLILAVLYGLLGIYNILPLRPQSVHQWAQCDRASVAWNYYKGYADFFHPRVNNTDNGTGITGLEFPIVQYFVSILYRLFGFHEWLYRLTTLVVFTLGATAVFRLANYFLNNGLQSLLIMLLYVCSPLLTFYSCSFLPDIFSLSFAMIAWSLLIRYATEKNRWVLWKWFIAILVSCLIKPNSMIHLPVMALFLYRSEVWTFKSPFRFMGFFLLVAGSTVAWYGYAAWLSKAYRSEVFLLEMRPPKSWQEVKDVWEIVSKDWIERVYHPWILAVVLCLGSVVSLYLNPFKNKLSSYSMMMLAGTVSFLIMMLLQLSYHDYYIITMFPALVFLIITIGESFTKFSAKKGSIIYVLLLLTSIGFEFYFAKTHLRTSHKKDNWKYGALYNDKYFQSDEILAAGAISDTDQVIVVFDHSPDIALYLLGRRGVTVPYRKVSETLMGYLNTGRYKYVMFNKDSQVNDVQFNPSDYPVDFIGEAKGVQIFKLSSAFRPVGRSTPLSPWN